MRSGRKTWQAPWVCVVGAQPGRGVLLAGGAVVGCGGQGLVGGVCVTNPGRAEILANVNLLN